MSTASEVLGSSYRDPNAFVYVRDGVLLRQINPSHREPFDRFVASGLYAALVDEGLLVPHEEVDLALAADTRRVQGPPPRAGALRVVSLRVVLLPAPRRGADHPPDPGRRDGARHVAAGRDRPTTSRSEAAPRSSSTRPRSSRWSRAALGSPTGSSASTSSLRSRSWRTATLASDRCCGSTWTAYRSTSRPSCCRARPPRGPPSSCISRCTPRVRNGTRTAAPAEPRGARVVPAGSRRRPSVD